MARRHFRTRLGFVASEPTSAASVDDLGILAVQIGEHISLVFDALVVLPDGKVAVAKRWLAGLEWAALGLPFGDTAVEDRDIMSAEQRQHPPSAGS